GFTDKEERARKHPVFRIDEPRLRDTLGLPQKEAFRYSIEEFGDRLNALAEPLKKTHERMEGRQKLDQYESQLIEFERHLSLYEGLGGFKTPDVVPTPKDLHWLTLGEAINRDPGVASPYVASWKEMLQSYGSKDPARFNVAVAEYLKRLQTDRPDEV